MRIYYVHPLHVGSLSGDSLSHWQARCARAKSLGFDTLMTAPIWAPDPAGNPYVPSDPDSLHPALGEMDMAAAITTLSRLCGKHGLALMLDLPLDKVAIDGAAARAHPGWYEDAGGEAVRDPRRPWEDRHALPLRRDQGRAPAGFVDHWVERLGLWVQNGVAGFRCEGLAQLAPADWRELIQGIRAVRPDCRFLAWTPGVAAWDLAPLAGVGFDAVFSSFPWWDYRAEWLIEETARLRAIAPVIAPVEAPYAKRVASWRSDPAGRYRNAARAVWTAAVVGDGVFVPMGFEDAATQSLERDGSGMREDPQGDPDLHIDIGRANQWLARTAAARGPLHSLQGPHSGVTALFRGDGAATAPAGNGRNTGNARLVVLNPDDEQSATPDWDAIRARLPEGYGRLDMWDADRPAQDLPSTLAPGDMLRLGASRLPPVTLPGSDESRLSVTAAMRQSRLAIEHVTPAVDDGAFPIKRVLGQPITVQADVFSDGHDYIAVALLWRAADDKEWQRVPMKLDSNDRWAATFSPARIGRHYYAVQGWEDIWTTYRSGLEKKYRAGVDIALETAEGRTLVQEALERLADSEAESATVLRQVLHTLGAAPAEKARRGRKKSAEDNAAPTFPAPTPDQIAALLDAGTARAMHHADERRFETTSIEYPVTVDRPAAVFSSWYEIFPRSQSGDPRRHGTFNDVIAALPRVRAMGFDTLYFPPIHPIGTSNRKGRNNSLQAGPDDPGSPYAIGAAEGGHDALHPQLGTPDDFRRLVAAARAQGLELALDFAIQCSPDHPWLKAHPEWFDWRPDGSLRYAENPPKKYEDIVNVDFYGTKPGASRQAPLWRALRDAVLYWVSQGVRVFRVDNPHTKPLPFWQWMIGDVQARHPDVLFLSEAFTKPKMMYRLAKIGFTQSYTYFTWREKKQEFIEYLTELTQGPPAEFFRPHFFVNTPDINPRFLQQSGRGGFLIRAGLAATLSGLWGVYNGFELCEAAAVPGKEEYLDSEKYEIRAWDYERPGNIVGEITRLNAIRRANAALHTHLGLRWHTAWNDQVLFFSKSTPARDNVLLIAISLDPHQGHDVTLEVPMWEFGLPDDGPLQVEDLIDGNHMVWRGKQQGVHLHPHQPYRIWRVTPA